MNSRQSGRLQCPSREALLAFGAGSISDDEVFDQIAEHLEGCDDCIAVLSTADSQSLHFAVSEDETRQDFATEPNCQRARENNSSLPHRVKEPIPDQIANYKIKERLGAGGMGVVYKAWDGDLNRSVVVKLLRSFRLSSSSAVEQFKGELRTIGNLKHSAIVQAYHGGSHDGQPYLVMELLEGETLRELVSQRGPSSEKEACSIMRDIVGGIRFLHDKGLIHRDIKPTNIMVLPDGCAKLLDFGLALELSLIDSKSKGGVRGSIQFMAPEQATGEEVDERADVYAIGATLFYALTGKSPLVCDSTFTHAELLEEVKTRPRPSLSSADSRISRKLANLVDRSLSLNLENRPGLQEFEAHLGNLERKRMTWQRVVFLALIVGGLFSASQFSQGVFTSHSALNSTSYDCIFHDMFPRGNDSQWETADSTKGLGVFDASSEAFHIHTVEPTKKIKSVLLAEAIGTDKPEYANGIYSLRVSVDTMNTAAGGLFRWNNGNGYHIGLFHRHDNVRSATIVRFDNWSPTLLHHENIEFHPNEFFWMRVEFDGPDIALTVWPEKDPMPPKPKRVVHDRTFSSGQLGLLVAQNQFKEFGLIGAVFDDVNFDVPVEARVNDPRP